MENWTRNMENGTRFIQKMLIFTDLCNWATVFEAIRLIRGIGVPFFDEQRRSL